jgi:SAM-dependent methyltransferase
VLDIGGGAGYFTAEFRSRGAHCYLFEVDAGEMMSRGETPSGAVLADGYWLPVRDGGADICVSSNVLEHVRDPKGLIEEMVRATRPGGLIYLSFTNWYSPWGGHEMSPWHYLGAGAPSAVSAQARQAPKNRVGSSLFRLHVGEVLAMTRRRADMSTARPRSGLVPPARPDPRAAGDRDLEPAAYLAADRMTLAQAAGRDRSPGALSPLAGGTGGGRADGTARTGRWFVGVWLVALVILIFSSRGQIFFDTKLGVVIDPASFTRGCGTCGTRTSGSAPCRTSTSGTRSRWHRSTWPDSCCECPSG